MDYRVTFTLFAGFCILGGIAYFNPELLPISARRPVISKPTGSSPPPPTSEADQSLTEEGYCNLGFPPLNRDWTAADLSTAVSKLQSLNPDQLPVFQNAKSGPIFARFVDPQTLGLAQPSNVTPKRRLDSAFEGFKALSAIEKVYDAVPANRKEYYRNSEVEFSGALLRTMKVLTGAGHQVFESYAPDDPSYPAQVTAWDQVQRGASLLCYEAIRVVADPKAMHLDVAMRMKLFEYCQETIPDIAAQLNMANRKRIIDILEFYSSFPYPDPIETKIISLRNQIEVEDWAE